MLVEAEERKIKEKMMKIESQCFKDPEHAYTSKGVRIGEKVVVTEKGAYDWIA